VPDSVIPFRHPEPAREPPVDIEAEQALLGAVLINPAAYQSIENTLLPEHFANAINSRIFKAAATLITAGANPDPVMLKHSLGEEPLLASMGGTAGYIATLIRAAGPPSNAPFYAKAIKEVHFRRIAIAAATRVIDAANNPAEPMSDSVAHASHIFGAVPHASLTLVCAADVAARPAPARPWIVPEWLPSRQVTLLTGDGGTGKSQIAMQLQASASGGTLWLGLPVVQCRSIGFYAEDDDDELHRRLHGIAALTQASPETLSDMHWRSVLGDEAEMVEVDETGTIQPTPYFRELERIVLNYKARLLVLDAVTNLFGGDEIRRRQVNAFILLLRQLAIKMDGAVLLLGHPSASGIASGSGLSGSTHWHNAVRSRFYFARVIDEDADPDERTLSKMKANYAGAGDVLRVRWQPGGFVALDEPGSVDRAAQASKAERVFLAILASTYNSGTWTCPNLTARNYAPHVFARHADREGLGKPAFEMAMHRLLRSGRISTESYGRPSDPRARLRLI